MKTIFAILILFFLIENVYSQSRYSENVGLNDEAKENRLKSKVIYTISNDKLTIDTSQTIVEKFDNNGYLTLYGSIYFYKPSSDFVKKNIEDLIINNRLESTIFKFSGFVNTFFYNEKGYLIDENNDFFGGPINGFPTPVEGKTIITSYSKEISTVVQGVLREQVYISSNETIFEDSIYNQSSSSPLDTIVKKYNSDGLLISIDYSDSSVEYFYDEKKLLIEVKYFEDKKKYKYSEKYEYSYYE